MTGSDQSVGPVAERVRALLAAGSGRLPHPGGGETAQRWRALARVSRTDVVVGRLVEAHADADAILAELGGSPVRDDEWWGVWAAEPPSPRLEATQTPTGWELDGAKAWCSGAGMCTHALVTAHTGEERGLYAVSLAHPGVGVDHSTWRAPGMGRSGTGTVSFDHVPAQRVGSGADYLERAGFWHGGAGVAACWLGGAEAVTDTLRRAAESRPLDAHAMAHLGAVDATLAGARWTLDGAAAEVDADPLDVTAARVRALRVRAVVEAAATLVVDRVGRALGAAPLCLDGDHAAAVADVAIYVRQSHAERDLASLAALLTPDPATSRTVTS